jgi:hypothetical protein
MTHHWADINSFLMTDIKSDTTSVKFWTEKMTQRRADVVSGFLKLSITVFIVTAFSESQNRHKWLYLWPSQCDGFCKKFCKSWSSQKSQKELAKTRLLKLSKTSRILNAFSPHKTESQMVTIVTVTKRYLGKIELIINKVAFLTIKIL